MKTFKKMLVVLAAAVMMLVPMSSFAANSPSKVSLDQAVVSAAKMTYTGASQTAKITVKVGNTTLVEGKDYIVEGAQQKNAGTYTATIKGTGNYAGTATVSYKIRKASISSSKLSVQPLTYNKKTQKVVLTLNGNPLKEGTDYTVVSGSAKAKSAGTYKIRIKGVKNFYSGTKTIEYKVAKKKPTINVTAKKDTYEAANLKSKSAKVKLTVSGASKKAKVTYKSANSKVTVSSTGKVTLPKGLKAGDYKITVKVGSTANYKSSRKSITISVK